jgi:hypothetical protein
MSDIALLMTGVLTTGQPSPPMLPGQALVQSDDGENSTRGQLSLLVTKVVPTGQITPPEFMQQNEAFIATASQATIQENFGRQVFSTEAHGNTLQDFSSTQIVDKPDFTRVQDSSSKLVVPKSQLDLPNLYFGDSGIAVRILQRLLIYNGYRIRVDGIFGGLTEIAVKSFQYRRSLIVDGIVGQQTWSELTK